MAILRQNQVEQEVLEQELYKADLRHSFLKAEQEEYPYNLQTPLFPHLNPMNHPDAKKHQIVSFIKSGIRILGYILIPFDFTAAAIVLVISETVGIYEELV